MHWLRSMRGWGHQVQGREKLLFVVSGVPGWAVRMWWFLYTCCLLGIHFGNLWSSQSSLLTSCAVGWDYWALKLSMSLQWLWRNAGVTGSDIYTTDNWKGPSIVLSQTARNQTKISGIFFPAHWRHFFLSCDSLLWWQHVSVLAGRSSVLLCSMSSQVLATLPVKGLQGAGWRCLLQGKEVFDLSVFHAPLKLSDLLVLAFVFSTPAHVPGSPTAMAGAEGLGEKSDSEIRALSEENDSHLLSMFNPCS